MRSSGVAPALKLLAGDVVAAVEKPLPTVKRTKPRHVAATPSTSTAPVAGAATPENAPSHSSSASTRSAPAHRPAHRTSRRQAAAPTPAPTTKPAPKAAPKAAAPQATPSVAKHGNGKAKALGQAKKIALQTAAPTAAEQTSPAQGGHGHAYGRPADVSPGPPAVPPGHEQNGQSADDRGNSDGGGGGK